MSARSDDHNEDYLESVFLYALRALRPSELPVVEAHLSACAECRQELEALRPIIGAFVSWPTDVLRPSTSLWERLARRIAADTGQASMVPAPQPRAEPDREEAAPGLSYKVLAADTENDRVSLLVRLAPGAHYPPHRHGGVEELYLLHGELMIDDKTLYSGDYNRAEVGNPMRNSKLAFFTAGVCPTRFACADQVSHSAFEVRDDNAMVASIGD